MRLGDRPLVCCDIDGVLNDLLGPLCDGLWARHGVWIRPEEIVSWDTPRALVGDAADEIFDDLALTGELPFMLPALTAMRQIRGMARQIHIVTARPDTDDMVAATRRWLDVYGIPYEKLVFTADKAAYGRANGARYMIEDSLRHAKACHELGIGVFLVDAPYNREIEPVGGIWRVQSLLEIPELLAADLESN